MSTTLLMSLVISIAVIGIVWAAAITLITLLDSTCKEIVTGKFILNALSYMRKSFEIKTAILMVIITTAVFSLFVHDARIKIRLVEAGKCTCDCTACKKNDELLRKLKPMLEKLSMEEGLCKEAAAEK